MRARSFIYFVISYFAIVMMISMCMIMPRVSAAEFMAHDKIMDGFVNAQKAPQMGRPMIYLPSKKVFKGKHHKKGKPHGEQKFGPKRRSEPTPNPTGSATPTPTAVPCISHCGDPTGNHGSSGDGTIAITDSSADLRNRDSNIKDQVGPICTAYAGNAGVENLLGYKSPDFSEDYTFSLYGVYSVDEYANNVPGKNLALADMWPRGGKKQKPFATTNNKLLKIDYLGDGEIAKMKASLRAGHPVYLGLEVPADMASCLASVRPTTKVTSGGHAVLIVGYKDDASNPKLGGGYFTIKNSWSEGCGDHGYQYIPYSYCEKSYCYMYEMSQAQ